MRKSGVLSLRSRGTSKPTHPSPSPREEIKRRQLTYIIGMVNAHLMTKGHWGSVTTFKVPELSVSFLVAKDFERFLDSLALRVNNAPLSLERSKLFFADFDFNVANQMMGYIDYMFVTHPQLLDKLSH